MRQAVMVAPGEIEFREILRPKPGPNQVSIEIKRIGICGSDIHVYHGMHPYTPYPVVQGHEVSGLIAEVGEEVRGFSIGDKVTFMPQVTCGECYPCRLGMDHICESLKVMGFQTGGAAQEYFAIDAQKVLKVPDEIHLDHVAMIEPIAVAIHALRRGGGVSDKKVLVLGAGPIGNLVAQAARATGAKATMITDIRDYKLSVATRSGIDYVVNPNEQDLEAVILRHFGPDQADLILECVGIEATIEQAIQVARKGTTIVVVGVFGEKPRVDIGLVQDRELSLVGTLMYQREDYEKAIQLVSAKKIHFDALISAHFPFKAYAEAYQAIEDAQGNIMKVLVILGDDE
jgi:L-iditol 2-dehydrogenase